jgi:hypothetical protein
MYRDSFPIVLNIKSFIFKFWRDLNPFQSYLNIYIVMIIITIFLLNFLFFITSKGRKSKRIEEVRESDRRKWPPRGCISFTLGCGGGSIDSVKRSKTILSQLLRLTEFILPPPHPSVKEMYPRGAISYDQSGSLFTFFFSSYYFYSFTLPSLTSNKESKR